MKKPQKTKIGRVLTYLLFGLMISMTFYSYKKASNYQKFETVFKQEKVDLQNELDGLIKNYKELSIEKKHLSKRLIKEINKIIALKDSVKNLKISNYNLIRKYRKRIFALETENHNLFAKVDSLKFVNKTLLDNNTTVTETLSLKDSQVKKLAKTNKVLKRTQRTLKNKVAIAGSIKISPIEVFAMKERNNGKLRKTSNSSKTDAFKVNFQLLENEIATPGKKKIYIQIVDEKNNVIKPKGTTTLKGKNKIVYSDELIANYQNQKMNVISIILVNRNTIKEGQYKVNAFADRNYVGSTTIALK